MLEGDAEKNNICVRGLDENLGVGGSCMVGMEQHACICLLVVTLQLWHNSLADPSDDIRRQLQALT